MVKNTKEYYEKWYQEHGEAHKAYLREVIKCEVCDKEISRNTLSGHNKSKKHLKNVELAKKQQNIEINNLKEELKNKIKTEFINKQNKLIKDFTDNLLNSLDYKLEELKNQLKTS